MANTARFSNHLDDEGSDLLSLEDKHRAIEILQKNDEVLRKAEEQLAATHKPMTSLKSIFSGVLFGMTLGYFGKQPSRTRLK